MELVSIFVPSYNHEKFLDISLNSIIEQSYKNIELIIIDDGSKDNSYEKIIELKEKLEKRFRKLKIIKQENQGICKTFNKGLSLATGKYFCIMPTDDIMHKDFVLKQVNFLSETNKDFSFTNGYHVPNYLVERGRYDKGYTFDTRFNCHPAEDDFTYKNVFTLPSPSFMYKTEILKDVSGFDPDLTFEDVDIVLRLNEKFQIGYIDEYLFFHRIHENNSGSNKFIINEGLKQLYKKYVENNFLNLSAEKVNLIKMHFDEIKENFNKHRIKSLYNIDVEKILNIAKEKNLIGWGAGSFCEKFTERYPEVEFEYLVDSNKTGKVCGYNVYNPSQLVEDKENKFIVILSDFSEEISKQLVKMGFEENNDFY